MTEETIVTDEEKEALATSAEGKAEEEEAKGFTTPDDGEPEPDPADGGGGSKEDEASAAPEEKKEDKPTGEEEEAGKKTPEEGEKATGDATGKDTKDDGLIKDDDPKGVQKRINRAVKDKHNAEREADRLRGVIEGMNTKPPAPGDETTPAEVKRPVQEDFETEEAYIEALTDFKMDEKFATRDAKNAEKAEADKEATATTSRQDAFQEKIDKAREPHPDYDEVVFRNPDLVITKPMLREIEEIDNGAEVAYHLGKHPEEAEKIARLPQKAMERALWTIEAGLKTPAATTTTAPTKADTKKVSDAPDPIEPSGGGGGGGRIDLENESIEDFMDREKKRDLKAHGYG